MDGEISVMRAKPGSREVKKSQIGVEFKMKLSHKEVYEAIYMRKIRKNGTVILEVRPEVCFVNRRLAVVGMKIWTRALKATSLLRSLPVSIFHPSRSSP
jgi:hypothetical protein